MLKKKIVLFAYNFPHKKTQDFILYLISSGVQIAGVFAADAVKLTIPKSVIRSKIHHIGLLHPKQLCKELHIPYFSMPHNSPEIVSFIYDNVIEVGVISGARILKKHIIDAFSKGIVNFHPGLIPEARGLDAMLWSIYNEIPLGVTSHFIDQNIDAGRIIEKQHICVYKDDVLLDVSERIYETQLAMISTTLDKVFMQTNFTPIVLGDYNKKMPPSKEEEIEIKFVDYKKKFIC
ncbi:formyltransferase family protein [Breznakiella homolactica]|uniref:phosphoribosylglycinamide formyltransferase 1 n=1 Tax=Breznakiella homolactica TaxID=2798577 RepID=A0A7T7XP07_9SPIR|nr:formyltransferase family protein [Breznakiella homolactica]QQO09833.1 hypothetical protein JFL75_02675 [Breznakiella homolactica]